MNQRIGAKLGLDDVAEDLELRELGRHTSIDRVAQTIHEKLGDDGESYCSRGGLWHLAGELPCAHGAFCSYNVSISRLTGILIPSASFLETYERRYF